jgi:hypothetical protein
MLIKGTPPWSIDYQRINHDGTLESFKNITITTNDPNPQRRVATYELPIKSPGLYSVTAIRESSGSLGKVIPTVASVIACPFAHWDISSTGRRTLDECVDNTHDFGVQVTGSPPLQVFYSVRSDKGEFVTSLESTVEEMDEDEEQENLESLQSILTGKSIKMISLKDFKSFYSSKPITSVLQTSLKLETTGPHFIKLLYIKDGRNNTIVYEPPTKSTQLPEFWIQSNSKPDTFIIDVHPHPQVKFQQCDSIKIRGGVGYDSTTRLPILLEGSAPWSFQLSLSSSLHAFENGEPHLKDTPYNKVSSPRLEIPITTPGLYSLHNVSDKYCKGTLDLQAVPTCMVTQSLPPTVIVTAEPIEKSCVGAIGALVEISLKGDPPFWLDYDEVYKGVRTRRTAQIFKLRDTLSFTPVLPGTYLYEFKTV